MKQPEAEVSVKCRSTSGATSTLQADSGFTHFILTCQINFFFFKSYYSSTSMNNDTCTIPPLPLHNQMPAADAGKRKVKKTEKVRVLEESTDLDGMGKKVKAKKDKKRHKPCIKAIPLPEGHSDGSSDDTQDGDDEAGGKIK